MKNLLIKIWENKTFWNVCRKFKIFLVYIFVALGILFLIKSFFMPADINLDGKVDMLDYNIMMKNWSK